jgi:Family of unknown function (DUF6152)
MRLYVSTVLVAMFLLAIPALAHHSFTSFWYTDRTVEITGIVKTVKLVNPHANMTVEVTEANGEKSTWSITSKGSVSALRQAGWKEDTVTIGMKIKIEGNPSRKEGAKGLAAGKITKPDGSIVWFGGGGNVPVG